MYHVYTSPLGFYYFTTETGLNYVCRFKNCTNQLSPVLGIYDMEIYEFDFACHISVPSIQNLKRKDDKIAATISNLLNAFFTNELRVIVYVCDAADGRHRERHKVFGDWFKQYMQTALIRIPVEIKLEDESVLFTTYGCTLVRHDFPHMDVLQDELINKALGIISQKYEP